MTTVNKDVMVEALHLHNIFADQTKKATKEFLEDFFQNIVDEVARGNTVSIAGFGKFEPYTRSKGEVVPKFRPFAAFKEAVAENA